MRGVLAVGPEGRVRPSQRTPGPPPTYRVGAAGHPTLYLPCTNPDLRAEDKKPVARLKCRVSLTRFGYRTWSAEAGVQY